MNKILSYTLVLVLIIVIVIIAVQFMAPTIGNVSCYPNLSLGDDCYLQGYLGKCTENWESFPTGKLVLILPKTMKYQTQILGYYLPQFQIIGFAYSPSNYSSGEINEIKQQFLRELNLREYEAHIIKFDIFMDVNGYPRIKSPCDPQNDEFEAIYSKGESLFIDPDGLTVWRLSYERKNLQQDSHSIHIEFVHDDPGLENSHDDPCGFMCEYEAGSVPIELQIELQNELSIWGWIQSVLFSNPPFGSIFLLSLIALVVYLARKRIQKKGTNFQFATKEQSMKIESWGFSGSFSLGAVIGSILGLGLILSGAMAGFSALGVAIVTSAVIGSVIYAIDAAVVYFFKKITDVTDFKGSNGEFLTREPTNFMTTTLGKIVTGTAIATMITTSLVTATILPNATNDSNSSQSDSRPLIDEPKPRQTEDIIQDEENIHGQILREENQGDSCGSEIPNNESEDQLNEQVDAPSDYPFFEDFNSSQDFISTDPDLYIRDGYVYWEVSRSEGVQYIYRPIPPFSGDVKITVTGQIDGYTNNCQVRVGIGDGIQELGETIHDTGISIHFGFTGGGCPTNGPVVHASGVNLYRESDGCSPIGSLWVNAGTPITATLTVSDTATLDIEGNRSLTGTPLYNGEYNTLFVGLTDNQDWPSCWGTIDSIIIEPLSDT